MWVVPPILKVVGMLCSVYIYIYKSVFLKVMILNIFGPMAGCCPKKWIYIYIHILAYMYICICIYIYICVHVYTRIYIYYNTIPRHSICMTIEKMHSPAHPHNNELPQPDLVLPFQWQLPLGCPARGTVNIHIYLVLETGVCEHLRPNCGLSPQF